MKYLLETTESYRVSTEEEVTELIEKAKKDNHYILKKHTSQVKERKQINENKEYQEYLKLKEKYENKTDI